MLEGHSCAEQRGNREKGLVWRTAGYGGPHAVAHVQTKWKKE